MYDTIELDGECVETMSEAAQLEHPTTYRDILEKPIEQTEIDYKATQSGGRNRAPGRDGLGLEFYTANWTIVREDRCDIVKQMFITGATTTAQKQGVRVCVPKPHGMLTSADYQPIALFNKESKIVARIIAHRIRPVLEHLQEKQFCGVPGNTILNAVATVREAIAYTETKDVPLCVLSTDFKNAFDRIYHTYLFTILKTMNSVTFS
jgi:hypothetical protein